MKAKQTNLNDKARNKIKNKKHKKTRAEMNEEARKQKKLKNRKGNPAGTRHQDVLKDTNKKRVSRTVDPRTGSKVALDLSKYALGNEADLASHASLPAELSTTKMDFNTRKSLEKELLKLETAAKLERVLGKVDDGVEISAEEQEYLDITLARIEELYELLGIELEEEPEQTIDDEDEDPLSGRDNDLMRILKS